MNILWLCNIPLPKISRDMNIPEYNSGGWLTGLANSLLYTDKVKLSICFPLKSVKEITSGYVDKITYYAVPAKNLNSNNKLHSKRLIYYFKEVINKSKPDIIHIFGTEYPHTLSMIKANDTSSKVVINIQGLVSVCANHYFANLPQFVIHSFSIADFIVRGNIFIQRKRFIKRGILEREALRMCNHVIGRTDWDRACTKNINPNINYHFCNETLRDEFYKYQWDINNCKKYSIFISQGSYPIKGLHYMLEAMPIILKRFPNTRLYIAGTDVTRKGEGIVSRLKVSYYGKYIGKLINKNSLRDKVIFTGNLNEQDMCKQFLTSNVFVSASTIENSPNSLGEAMILGVPCVTSAVGGVTDMLEHKKEGFIYQHDAPYMLAYYVCKIFEDDDLAIKFSQNAGVNARKIHDKKVNAQNMLEIYKKIEAGSL